MPFLVGNSFIVLVTIVSILRERLRHENIFLFQCYSFFSFR